MTQDRTIQQQLQNLAVLPEAELLAIPDANLSPETLTEVWTRSAEVKARKAADESADRDAARGLRDGKEQEESRQKERREQALMRFQADMRDVQERSDQLAERIEREEAADRDRLREIEQRAITLKDGRKVYVGQGRDYLDNQGNKLQGSDRDEADALHRQKPDAATWAEKSDTENQYEAARRLRQKVEKLHDDAGRESGQGLSADQQKSRSDDYNSRLSGYEKEFQGQVQNRTAALSGQAQVTDDTYGGSDYMAAYGGAGRSTSYASMIDTQPANGALKKDFAPAALPLQPGEKGLPQQAPGDAARPVTPAR